MQWKRSVNYFIWSSFYVKMLSVTDSTQNCTNNRIAIANTPPYHYVPTSLWRLITSLWSMKLYSQTEIVVKWLLSCMYVLISKETQYKRVVTIRLLYVAKTICWRTIWSFISQKQCHHITSIWNKFQRKLKYSNSWYDMLNSVDWHELECIFCRVCDTKMICLTIYLRNWYIFHQNYARITKYLHQN